MDVTVEAGGSGTEDKVGAERSGATRGGSVEEELDLAPPKKKWEDGMVGIGGTGLNLFLDGRHLGSEASSGPKTSGLSKME